MLTNFFLKGMLVGFSIAAPVGPIGVLCIRRSLAQGPAIGLSVGLGAAVADAAYGGIAGFGLTAISSFLIRHQFWFQSIGGIFMIYLGIRLFKTCPVAARAQISSDSHLAAFGSTFFLTLANPTTILSFLAIFAGIGLGAVNDYSVASVLVFGVFSGSAAWWLILSNGIGLFRSRVDDRLMKKINQGAGMLLVGFGIFSFLTSFRHAPA